MEISKHIASSDFDIIHSCLLAAVNGPFFQYEHTSTIIGADEEELKEIAERWPAIGWLDLHIQAVVLNVMLNLWGYPHGCEAEWSRYIPVSEEEVMLARARLEAAFESL